MKRIVNNLSTVYLDIWDLTIFNVTDKNGKHFNYKIDDPNPNLGQRLSISIPSEISKQTNFTFVIGFETSPKALAISWLTPQQTSGKKLPYMFTQCESIYARSLAPFQDTPSIKSTYTVNTKTIPEITTRVSGNLTHESNDTDYRYTRFEMNIPVQAYLLAIASGNLAERKIGERTFVITEPEELDKVAHEFVDLENFLIEAENITIPYEWGEYKLLILPPSFPFGGMENPLLTFASPAIVPGDRSSVDVAIHEIAHSWFGNLVTNNNWTNFWLNEGFTVYLERRVVRNIFGINHMKVTAKLENQSMYFDMLDYGLNNSYSSLYPIFNGNNPDDAFSTIPYEKGFQFLTFIETLIGEDHMTDFLREYLAEFLRKSLGTTDFIDFFRLFIMKIYSSEESKEILSKIDFETWIFAPGLPPVTLDFDTPEYNGAINLATDFIDGKADPATAVKIYRNFTIDLKGLFITHLINNIKQIDDCKAEYIDDTLSISKEINGEVIFRWLQVAIRSGQLRYPYALADDFVGSIGRMKFIIPVYTAIFDQDPSQAKAIYAKHKDFYHPLAVEGIEKILNGDVALISE